MMGNNPKDRYGLAKVPFSLIPESASVFLAMGLKHGARKYGPFNWRVEPVQGRVYLEAAKRHLALILDGEDFDRDTGVHHGAFVLATMAIYMDAMVQGTLIDNRALRGRTGDLVAFFNELPGQGVSRSELVKGFKKLVPSGHLLFDALERSVRPSTTKKRSVKRISKRYAKFIGLDPKTRKVKVKKGKKHARR